MADEDGVDDFVESQVRLGLLLATKAAHSMAERRREEMRAAEQNSQSNTQQLQQMHEAERAAAVAALRGVGTSPWWEQAKPEHIAREWERAATWAGEDPRAAQAQDRLVDGLRDKYGISVDRESVDYRDLAGMVRQLEPAAEDQRERARDHRDVSEAILSEDNTQASGLERDGEHGTTRGDAGAHARAADHHEGKADHLAGIADSARAGLSDLTPEQAEGFSARTEAFPSEPAEAVRGGDRHPRARKGQRQGQGRGVQRQAERSR
ncbi:hypothetical protein ACI3EY_16930 [Ornithinimicrobium sp. LYQ92]|uniref:hypothetical protein n=1 Tax=Serinicoccus sp. LYQ92 TaxID=3378798 RepID=UPI0038523811